MAWWRDILRQCVYMCLFIIPIPIGAYTIHNDSSAMVALLSYLILSVFIPIVYLKQPEARFGKLERGINWRCFFVCWVVVRILLMVLGSLWQGSNFWGWPTIGRDFVFVMFMYVEVSAIMLVAYLLTRMTDRSVA